MDTLGESSWSGSLESDDSFLESSTTTDLMPGDEETYATHPPLTDTAASMNSDEINAFLDFLLDDVPTSDDESTELSAGSDDRGGGDGAMIEVEMHIALLYEDCDGDSGELTQGLIGESYHMQPLRTVVMLDLKRKRDALIESGADYKLPIWTRERKEYRGRRAGSSMDHGTVFEDDASGPSTLSGAADCIVLSDSDPENDAFIPVASDLVSDDASGPSTLSGAADCIVLSDSDPESDAFIPVASDSDSDDESCETCETGANTA